MLITARKQKARNSRIPKKNLEFLSKTRIPKPRILEFLEPKTRIPKLRILEF